MPRGKHGMTAKQAETFLKQIAAGDTQEQAAEAAGVSTSVFRTRANPTSATFDKVFAEAYAEALDERAARKADLVDTTVEQRALEADSPPPILKMWAERWHPGFRDRQGEQSQLPSQSDPEDRSASLADVARVLEAVGALAGIGRSIDRGEIPADRPVLPAPLND